ncbi:hypothetical protein LWI28_021102 [Acer negundo]|uniref:BOI-related E3 ubiquitin-protein ligase 2 n=1 Tax=Acer negundo TaxID=4023 RepID=A0AAD5P6F8_ACENE|nr:hypothetical protein LWI28_021102 [Acer negundo]KAK4860584.1 hypothetical protein QYF36_026681 [Acer negundo]
MAVQAQLFPENLGYILPPSVCGGVQDWTTINPVPATAAAAFGSDPPQQQPLFGGHHLQQSNQSFGFDCNIKGLSSSSSSTSTGGCGGGGNIFISSMAMSRSLDAQLELQRQEIDYFLQIQSERLRSVLQEQRKKQLIVMLKSLESKAVNLMRQKEEDLFQARNKTMELEACLREAEIESETWQRLARENEAMVVDLSNTLQQVRERLVLVSNTAEDAESSFCGSCDDDHHKQQQQQEMMMIACKRCNSRGSCVLFLPCRHLCSCKHCEPFLVSCPVCKSAKEASMEVFWV